MGNTASRKSLFATPAALVLGVAFVALFYAAIAPVVDLRASGNGIWMALLGVAAAGIPGAGFWQNRAFLQQATPREKSRAATLLVTEAAAFIATLTVFANLTGGGEEESSTREKVNQLLIASSDAQRLVESRAAQSGAIEGVGNGARLQAGGSISEANLGADGTVLLYDEQLRALATMVPSTRDKIVDWALTGFPARAFPPHWQGRASTSFTAGTRGNPTDHSQQMLVTATKLQYEISAEAKKRGGTRNVVASRLVPADGPLDFGYVDPNGWFALYSDRHGIYMHFQPELQADGLVHWQCRVYPAEAAVPGCASGRR